MLALVSLGACRRPEPRVPASLERFEVSFLRSDGSAIAGALYGWFTQTPEGVHTHGITCCSDEHGRVSFRASELPDAEQSWLYLIEPSPGDAYALAKIDRLHPQTMALHPGGKLVHIRGTLSDKLGQSLAALVNMVPKSPASTPFERALLSLQPKATGANGRFDIRAPSMGPFELHVSTWERADDSAQHVYTRDTLVAPDVVADDHELHLTVPGADVVSCTLTDSAGKELSIVELGIQLFPHGKSAHNNGCAFPGGEDELLAQPDRSPSTTIRFLWPAGAKELLVFARGASGTGEPMVGTALLKDPSDRCHVAAHPEPAFER
jgi:hypothetical protein